MVLADDCGAAGAGIDVAAEAERLRTDGYLILRGVLSAEICDTVREHVLRTSDEAKKLGRNDLFGNIQEADKRTDLKLDLCPPVVEAINQFGSRCGTLLQDVMNGIVRVVELAAITSSGGAVAQPVHADTMHGVTRFLQSDVALHTTTREREDADSEDEDADEDLGSVIRAVATDTALIFTSLIALQDVSPDMGPTLVWPQTNTVEHHATLWGTAVGGKLSVDEADKAFGVAHKQMTLGKGDLVLYDSRTMHCGGANVSDKRRSVLCISVMGPGIRPDGTTWTMLPSLRNQIVVNKLPLAESVVRVPANSAECEEVRLPPPPMRSAGKDGGAAAEGDASEGPKPIPPLEEWDAAVLCTLCRRWRPCGAAEAPKLTALEAGFQCPLIGHSCMQDQVYTDEEIDALF
mmetsp:Transcript_11089/g.27684  ORF Transcript_11089/g.27684 Transcript_11089/m.27684 type:complete len:405 (+) Transcript_11089:51-1265(+)|eukprot:CAMPEP_0115444728 /NCGR_PEP_ID=MMETSP0271-20121206/38547_1 /TAXON_ID=71861 /ORGANISM="Scrippsiella trochoidea, Strain CCMP3099" /LENGTH=404 /DNA_ID=CAMNT_0002870671 /DNA_START=57 /DNA_END=1271 /DNA_ORIENTATION=+